MPKTLIPNLQPLVETSKFVSESEAIMAAVNPKGHLSPLITGHPFVPNQVDTRLKDKNSKKWETISGDTYINGEPHSTSVLIKYPGFIKKAIARARRGEASAQMHITIK